MNDANKTTSLNKSLGIGPSRIERKNTTMRTLINAASTVALMAANADAGAAPAPELKLYHVTAGPRNSKDAGKEGEQVTFVIKAIAYKRAWELAREVTRTGSADFVETHGQGVLMTSKEDAAAPKVKAGQLSVKSVDSLQERRSKKDALTVDRLMQVCEERGVKIPSALQALITELQETGPAAPAADAATTEQAQA